MLGAGVVVCGADAGSASPVISSFVGAYSYVAVSF